MIFFSYSFIFILLINIIYNQELTIISINPSTVQALENQELTLTVSNIDKFDPTSTVITIGVTDLTCLSRDGENIIICNAIFPLADIGRHNIQVDGLKSTVEFKIDSPNKFSKIYYVYGTYYNTSAKQSFNLRVDNTYNIEIAKINLVKDKVNESLSDCEIGKDEDYIVCYGTITEPGLYVFYVNNVLQQQNGTNVSLIVYDDPFEIGSIINIEPSEMLINDLNRTFTLTVDFSVNIENSVIYLMEQTNNKKIKLGNCIDDLNDEITLYCYGVVNKPGAYSLFLNGVDTEVILYVYDVSLTYAFSISPEVLKWESPFVEAFIIIKFDSVIAYTTKKIELRPSNEDSEYADLTFQKKMNYIYIQYLVRFYSEDTYYLYIDDEIQEDVYIKVTSESFTSKIISIYPSKVITDDYVFYNIEVDKTLGIDQVNLKLVRDLSSIDENEEKIEYEYNFDSCKRINNNYVKCRGYTKYSGIYDLYIDEDKQDVSIDSKNYPSITSRVPKHAKNSTYKQSLTLIFDRSVYDYRNSITLVSEEYNSQLFCRIVPETSEKRIICAFRIYNEGTYQICIEGYTAQEYLYINSNIDFDSSDKSNFLKFSILYFIGIFFILF